MSIKSIPTAWKDELRTGTLADRDFRLYCDFRGIEYPDLGTGSAAYTLAREDNLIDRGNCESTTAPMLFGETTPVTSNCTWERSSEQAHSGDYSYKYTATTGDVDNFATLTESGTSNMAGTVSGESYEFSAWVYIPSGGVDYSEVKIRIYEHDGTSYSVGMTASAAETYDAWQELTGTITLADDTTGFLLRIDPDSTMQLNEYFYVDDIRLTAHSVPGSHCLSSGYIETLCPMTETFTIQVKFKPNFAHDTASGQRLFGWFVSATQHLYVHYHAVNDIFLLLWEEGGTQRYLQSAQYDDGTTYRNINQWITLTAAIDLSTGTTAGSSLWLDKTQDDTAWSGNIDAKSTEFNTLQIRAYDGTAGDYDIAYVRYWPNRILTDAEVQTDAKDVADEEIFWSLDGHGTGRTRCNINTSGHRVVEHYDIYKGINGKLIESYGANTFNFRVNNDDGAFSDDQNAAWDPANAVYNGTNSQNYLQNRFGVIAESWYNGDFDFIFNGRATEDGFRRQSKNTNYSRVRCEAEDGVGDLDRYVEETGRVFSANMLARHDTLLDRGGCESTTNPAMYGETSTTLSNATFARSETRSYSGRYSYLGTKTVAAGTAVTITLADNTDAGDMHGLTAGSTYTLQAAIYIPTGMLGSELSLAIVDSAGSTTQAASNTYDEWQIVEVEHTVDAGATYAYPQIQIASTAANTETFFIDQIKLIPDDLSEAHDISLFHNIAKRGYRRQLQFIANNNFENTTLGDSWLVTTGGTITKTADTDMVGTYSCRLQPGAAAEQLYQTVTFTGSRKLSVGQDYTLQCYLKTSAAASGSDNYIEISEQDSGGENDSTSETYTLAGGEGYKFAYVTHTITDKDSDRLVVNIGAAAGDDIYVKMVMLCESETELYYFEENENDGASGVESADDAEEISWPWFGIRTGNVDYIHPWRRMEQNSTVWANLKSVGAGTGATYCGFDENGTLINEAILDNGYSDPVPMDTITDVATDTNHILLDGLNVFLDAARANMLYGVGNRYAISGEERLIATVSASGAFADATGNNYIDEDVPDGEYWPDPDEYPEFWIEYGTTESAMDIEEMTHFDYGAYLRNVVPKIESGAFSPWAADWWKEKISNVRQAASKADKIIGVQNASLFHKTAGAGDADGALSYVTSGTLVSGLDITSRAGEARILLLNDTGGTETVTEAAIVGQPVYRFTGKEGYVHDSFINRADIVQNGVRLLDFGGADVISDQQLNRMADFLWKDRGQRKHIYICASYGALHDIGPNDWYWIDVGQAGTAENVAGTMVAAGIRISADADTHGMTEITYREAEEAWKYDSNAIARFIARGVPIRSPSTAGDTVVVGAEFSTVDTDFRVPSGSTSAEDVINPAITLASETFGGGTVKVKNGTYKIDGPVVMKSNVQLLMEPGVVIEKNHDGYAITAAGSSGSELENIIIAGGKVTRNASDTNSNDLIYFNYVDDFVIKEVNVYDSYYRGIVVANCDGGIIEGNTIRQYKGGGIRLNTCTDVNVIANRIYSGEDGPDADCIGIHALSGSKNNIANNVITTISCSADNARGIAIEENYTTVDNNSLGDFSSTGTAVYGITSSGNYNKVTSNTISNLDASSSGAIVAVSMSGDYGSVQHNTIYDLAHSGTGSCWGLYYSGEEGNISGNHVAVMTHTGTDGLTAAILLQSARGTATYNKVKSITINNASNSKDVRAITSTSLSDNAVIANNGIQTIRITAGSGTAYGVHAVADEMIIGSNNVTNVDDYGIFIIADDNTVAGNIITGCDTGIEIDTTADNTVVTGNRSTGNTTDNFDDNSSSATTTDSGNDWT